jgi:hypothetical protein
LHTEASLQAAPEKAALESPRSEYSKEVGELKALVTYQEKLKNIQILKDQALTGDFNSFRTLTNYPSSDQTLKDAAAFDSNGMYILGERTRGVSIQINNPDGTPGDKDEQITTAFLISTFLLDSTQPWPAKAKAAEILTNRREAAVPPALIEAMNQDANLWVRRAALRSFETLTGYQEQDVFDFGPAANWWGKNAESYLKSLPKKQPVER